MSKKFVSDQLIPKERGREGGYQMLWPSLGQKEYSSTLFEHVKEAEAKIRKAIEDGDVYVRTVRVDFEPESGQPRTVTPGAPVKVK